MAALASAPAALSYIIKVPVHNKIKRGAMPPVAARLQARDVPTRSPATPEVRVFAVSFLIFCDRVDREIPAAFFYLPAFPGKCRARYVPALSRAPMKMMRMKARACLKCCSDTSHLLVADARCSLRITQRG